MRAIVLFFLMSGMLSLQANAALPEKQKLSVLNTIKPIQALVLAIAGDKVDSYQLIPDYASPHFYNFKPSDLRKIKRADIIFRIDPSMEVMLNHALEEKSNKNRVISLAEAPNIKLIPASKAHASHDEHEITEKDRQHMDMHIWTSPHNAIAMAEKITDELAKADPDNRSYFISNLKQFSNKLKELDQSLAEQLKTVKNKPYIVFHDSWQYFSQAYGLKQSTLVSFHERIAPGAKTLPKIRKLIKSEKIHCIFTKPGMNPAWIRTLTENLKGINITEIDVIASTLTMSDQLYLEWLRQMGKQIQACLHE